MELPPFVRAAGTGTHLDVYVQPGAARGGLVGLHGESLKLKVQAPAQDDKANRAVLELLATVLDLPRDRLEIVSGHKSRRKRILLSEMSPAVVVGALRSVGSDQSGNISRS
ncbi:MAG TPA: DUF167 domain-containing protein [Actinomycetota bacterium]|nr:DUF167 domain-containing protein [Actinomycetota bacterium]